MQELFIKCPSCGAVLQVKNSKNEAVKRISCPNCKKQLAVSFEDNGQPLKATPKPLGAFFYGEMRIPLHEGINQAVFPGSSHVEVNVVRIADGSSKCIVRALDTDVAVKVNGEQLQQGDKLVMTVGDKLEIDHHLLCYDRPSVLVEQKKVEKPKENTPKATSIGTSSSSRLHSWLPYAVAVLAFALVAIILWPRKTNDTVPSVSVDTTNVRSLPTQKFHSDKNETKVIEKQKKENGKQKESPTVTKQEDAPLTEYDLHKLASKGDANALYELGRLYLDKRGSNNTVLGLNYLKRASQNGSPKASVAYQKCMNRLQQKAASGDSIAQVILISVE